MRELRSSGSLLSPLEVLRTQQKPEASSCVFHGQGHQHVSDQMVRKVSAQGTTRRLHLRNGWQQGNTWNKHGADLQMMGCGWELSSFSSL